VFGVIRVSNLFLCIFLSRQLNVLPRNCQFLGSTLSVLERHNVAYWPEFATLLNVVRNENGINPWDHDSDLSVVHPGQDRIAEYMEILSDGGRFTVVLQPERTLFQISAKDRPGPHCDVWMWKYHTDEAGREYLMNIDYSIKFPYHPMELILPLTYTVFMGKNITVARQSHKVSKQEFSPNSNGYMKSTVYTRDCFHNFFHLRGFYT